MNMTYAINMAKSNALVISDGGTPLANPNVLITPDGGQPGGHIRVGQFSFLFGQATSVQTPVVKAVPTDVQTPAIQTPVVPVMPAAHAVPAMPNVSVVHLEKSKKFNGTNLKCWQQKMLCYLTTQNMSRFLKGETLMLTAKSDMQTAYVVDL